MHIILYTIYYISWCYFLILRACVRTCACVCTCFVYVYVYAYVYAYVYVYVYVMWWRWERCFVKYDPCWQKTALDEEGWPKGLDDMVQWRRNHR